ncbi:phosphocholine cytidylyltransferase family protein [Bacteriovoracaceae bacterium]|nr:phosphocholine cytidylyltransferase family protein [Bacteriovoracaceae bacterium]
MKCIFLKKYPITTALILAAGTGSRLQPLTNDAPKCLTMVNGKSILERMIEGLNSRGFKKLVIVTGHLEDKIREFLGNEFGNIQIEYIFSPSYKVTNNIFSLWMARKKINEPFLLLESDLIYDECLLDSMLIPNRIAVAKMQPWLNGTCVTIDQSSKVKSFLPGDSPQTNGAKYKTVNIYSLSLKSWNLVKKRISKHISANKINNYYETVFTEMVADGSLSLKASFFDNSLWYEIDTIQDLRQAEKLFPEVGTQKQKIIKSLLPGYIKENIINEVISSPKITGALSVVK